MKALSAILTLCITLPLWYFLLYGILKRIDASDAAFMQSRGFLL